MERLDKRGGEPMLVTMSIYREGDGELERYTVPANSWIATRSCGMQPVPAILERTVERWQDVIISYRPAESPPLISAPLLKLVSSRDKKWGKNGHEWMGNSREQQGGQPLDRCKEYIWKLQWLRDPPVVLSPQEIEAIRNA